MARYTPVKREVEYNHDDLESWNRPSTSTDNTVFESEMSPPSEEVSLIVNTKNEILTYQLEKYKHKILVIFNHAKFDCNLESRQSTKHDVDALKRTFKRNGFKVKCYEDKTVQEIKNKLKKFTDPKRKNFTDYGCIAVAVLTHGYYDGILMAKDKQYKEQQIINYLKSSTNNTFMNKPRIIIIQACRGENDIRGVGVHQPDVHRFPKKTNSKQERSDYYYTLDLEPDMLVLHSSYIGNTAHSEQYTGTDGSWFIQTLCDVFDKRASTEDLTSMITEVKRRVAIDKTDEIEDEEENQTLYNKQMPVSTSTLTKKLYLKRYEGTDDLCIDTTCDCIRLYLYSVLECIRTCCYIREARSFNSLHNMSILQRAQENSCLQSHSVTSVNEDKT
ncbi:caspase-6-like [Galleria mellonella]|uniref:Caspase-6-like n=1 Tax=Galleria mellonella TaxID=7137 RepID=A0A6J3C6M4_GALME|nr:caspase-6-like [Galleria mellonella]